MSLLDKIFRSNPFNNPGYPMTEMNVNQFLESFGSNSHSDSGEVVNVQTSLHTSTVWACVSLISKQIATNSLFMYGVDDKGNKSLATDHDYFDLVLNRPNPYQNSVSFRTAVQISLLLHGNGYIEIQRDNGGRVVALYHRSSERTTPEFINGTLLYCCTDGEDSDPRYIKCEDMIHLMATTLNGFIGLSPIAYARQSIGSKIAMDKYGGRFFANNATPSGILTTKQKMKPEDKPKMRSDWESQSSGANSHRVQILDQEMTFQPISIPQNDSQFLESRNSTEKEIAAIFGVPGYAIGLLDKGIKANVEQQAQDLYNYCLRPIMATWEKEFTCKLFSTRGRSANRFVVKFDTRELLRPDAASRQTYYQSMIQNGVLSQDEVRSLEGYNAIPNGDGDGYYIQLNMQSLAMANSTDPTPNPPDVDLQEEMEANSLPKRLGQQYRTLFKDGIQRIIKSNVRDSKTIYRCLWPTLDTMSKATNMVAPSVSTSRDKAVDELLTKIEHRAKTWTEDNLESICDDEIKRAAKQMIYAARADEGLYKAKNDVALLETDATEGEDDE